MKKPNFSFRCIAYQDMDGTFTGVCLDLDIVEEGHATIQEATLSISDAIASHMQAIAKLGFPKELIFRPAPKEYWNKLGEIIRPNPPKIALEPFQFFIAKPSSILAYV